MYRGVRQSIPLSPKTILTKIMGGTVVHGLRMNERYELCSWEVYSDGNL